MSEAAALVALAASLLAAVARPRWAPDWAVASLAAAALAVGGVLSGDEASAAVRHLGPTVGFSRRCWCWPTVVAGPACSTRSGAEWRQARVGDLAGCWA